MLGVKRVSASGPGGVRELAANGGGKREKRAKKSRLIVPIGVFERALSV